MLRWIPDQKVVLGQGANLQEKDRRPNPAEADGNRTRQGAFAPSPVLKFANAGVGWCCPVHVVRPSTGCGDPSWVLVHLVTSCVVPSVCIAFAARQALADHL